ncbi:pilus assembly protein FimV [Frankineae bacterium MT45]|nr:pilus assembly protein FimV [Frankineae bacterium MT45]
MKAIHRVAIAGTGIALLSGALVGCGGSSTSGTTSSASASSTAGAAAGATGAAGASGAAGGRGGLFSDSKVQQCLTAAGISIPTGGGAGGAGGAGGTPPSGAMPSGGGTPPSGFPSGGARPSGAPGGMDSAQQAKIQAALKACGISLPTGGAGAPASAAS